MNWKVAGFYIAIIFNLIKAEIVLILHTVPTSITTPIIRARSTLLYASEQFLASVLQFRL